MARSRRTGVVSGISLIVIGLLLFWLNRLDDLSDSIVFFVIGSVFLGAYFYGKNFGLLIPACILLGLGAGRTLPSSELIQHPLQFGLGTGFVAIFAIALLYERQSHWWPLIPGGILLLKGFSIGTDTMRFLLNDGGWALVLVVIGVFILLGTFRQKKRSHQGTD